MPHYRTTVHTPWPPRRAFEYSSDLERLAETGTLLSVDVITFEPTDDGGCRVTYDADLSLKGAFRFGDPLLGVVFGRIGDRAAGGLRRVLEATVG